MAGNKPHRTARWQQRIPDSGDPAGQLAVSYDRLRRAAARMCRKRSDVIRQAESATLAASVMREAADVLDGMAARLERSEDWRGKAS